MDTTFDLIAAGLGLGLVACVVAVFFLSLFFTARIVLVILRRILDILERKEK